jgi:integrase/recombinase XerD
MNGASRFPALLEAFFVDRLIRQRQASAHTITSYRDTFRLLLQYAQQRLSKAPSQMTLSDLDTPLLGAFLDHLEQKRDNSALATCGSLPSIRSFATSLCMRRSTVGWLSACSPCQVNATCVGPSASSHRSK